MNERRMASLIDVYDVSEGMADRALHLPVRAAGPDGMYTVASGSEPGVTYLVTDTGPDWRAWTCTCVAPGPCSHTLAAAAHNGVELRRAARRVTTGAGVAW